MPKLTQKLPKVPLSPSLYMERVEWNFWNLQILVERLLCKCDGLKRRLRRLVLGGEDFSHYRELLGWTKDGSRVDIEFHTVLFSDKLYERQKIKQMIVLVRGGR